MNDMQATLLLAAIYRPQTEKKTAVIRRIAVRETNVSQHNESQ